MNPTILGVIGRGFLNQVPTLTDGRVTEGSCQELVQLGIEDTVSHELPLLRHLAMDLSLYGVL